MIIIYVELHFFLFCIVTNPSRMWRPARVTIKTLLEVSYLFTGLFGLLHEPGPVGGYTEMYKHHNLMICMFSILGKVLVKTRMKYKHYLCWVPFLFLYCDESFQDMAARVKTLLEASYLFTGLFRPLEWAGPSWASAQKCINITTWWWSTCLAYFGKFS